MPRCILLLLVAMHRGIQCAYACSSLKGAPMPCELSAQRHSRYSHATVENFCLRAHVFANWLNDSPGPRLAVGCCSAWNLYFVLQGSLTGNPGSSLELVAADITQRATLLPEMFADVRALVVATAVKVAPKEGDTEDRAKYRQVCTPHFGSEKCCEVTLAWGTCARRIGRSAASCALRQDPNMQRVQPCGCPLLTRAWHTM